MYALWNAKRGSRPFEEMEALDIANAFFQECGAAQLSAVKFAGFEAQVLPMSPE
jgi:hypothetical protein